MRSCLVLLACTLCRLLAKRTYAVREQFDEEEEDVGAFLQEEEASVAGPCSAKSKTGGFLGRGSCARSWVSDGRSGGRCAWLETGDSTSTSGSAGGTGSCVPNCAHMRNQDPLLCERGFCNWDGISCSFDRRNVSIRRDYCAGQTEQLTWAQKDFCKGMRTGAGIDDGSFHAHGRTEPLDAIKQGMMRCWRPAPDNRSSYADPDLQEEMLGALRDELGRLVAAATGGRPGENLPLHPKTTTNPLNMFGPMKDIMPAHHAVGLTSKRQWPSHCLNFDYSGRAADAGSTRADAAGCGFFAASFGPVKELFQCVEAKFTGDAYWQLWDRIAEKANRMSNDKDEFEEEVSDPALLQKLRERLPLGQLPAAEVPSEQDIVAALIRWHSCKMEGKCLYLSSFHRVVEFFKFAELDSWDGHGVDGVRKILRNTLSNTMTRPEWSPESADQDALHGSRNITPRLAEATVNSMLRDCFKLGEPSANDAWEKFPLTGRRLPFQALHVESADFDKVSAESSIIKESLRCFPLMWDYAEVPAAPKTALWPTDYDAAILAEYPGTHPLCGRIALAGLARQFGRARYPPLKYLGYYTAIRPISDSYCMDPSYAQCINFEACWTRMMVHHVGKVNALCRVTEEVADTCCCKPLEVESEDVARALCSNDNGTLEEFTRPFTCCKLVWSPEGCSRHATHKEEPSSNSCSSPTELSSSGAVTAPETGQKSDSWLDKLSHTFSVSW